MVILHPLIPAKAGVQQEKGAYCLRPLSGKDWIPASDLGFTRNRYYRTQVGNSRLATGMSGLLSTQTQDN
jgi:hypothetical protein